MAPEILTGARHTTIADEWSTGVVLFQLATLKLPVEPHISPAVIMKKLGSGKFDNSVDLIKSPVVKDLVSRLLVLNPEKRAQANEMIPLFKKAVDENLRPPAPPAPPPPSAPNSGPVSAVTPAFPLVELDTYRIEDRFDVLDDESPGGVFGDAFTATHKSNSTIGVLKICRAEKLTNAAQFELLKKEVTAMTKLSNPNLITYRFHFKTPQNDYVIFVDRGKRSLASLIASHKKKKTTFPEADIWSMRKRLTEGLLFLHGRDIIHRDVQPTNIFVKDQNTVKLGDLGIIKQQLGVAELIRSYPKCVAYLAPELIAAANQRGTWTKATDAWSLGCTLHEVAALERTFDGNDGQSVANKVQAGSYKAVPSDKYSSALSNLIQGLLQKESSKRKTVADADCASEPL